MDYVRRFEELRRDDVGSVGGKCASLGELTSAGVRVPAGFAVTTDAFQAFLATADPNGEIRSAVEELVDADTATVESASKKLKARITSADMPDAVRAAITDAWRELAAGRHDVPLAVRSSATCEDSEAASFAGLQDTYLWTRGENDLIDRVRACWASIYNAESITYRRRLDLDESDIGMAVAVQAMVDAEAAGVMFTRSPTTGDRSVIVIESSWGLGSSLVSGEVTPDRFVVNKVTGEITTRDIADKASLHAPDTSGSGVVEREVDTEQRTKPSVTDGQIAELWQIARDIEKHYGSPQDIEWAVPKAGTAPDTSVRLLQSRPETVWAAKERAPSAKPQAKAFDHVLGVLSRKS